MFTKTSFKHPSVHQTIPITDPWERLYIYLVIYHKKSNEIHGSAYIPFSSHGIRHGISILKAALPSVERLLLPLETCGGHLWRTEDVENFRGWNLTKGRLYYV